MRRAWNDSLRDASCWSVEVVNGGAGCFLRCDFLSSVTMYSAPERRASIPSACSFEASSAFFPSISASFAANARFEEAAVNFASMLQYSCDRNARISSSRSTIILTATDCTRPADSPRLTFFHRNGESL